MLNYITLIYIGLPRGLEYSFKYNHIEPFLLAKQQTQALTNSNNALV